MILYTHYFAYTDTVFFSRSTKIECEKNLVECSNWMTARLINLHSPSFPSASWRANVVSARSVTHLRVIRIPYEEREREKERQGLSHVRVRGARRERDAFYRGVEMGRTPVPSLILSALLSASLDCISAAVPQCRRAMHLPVVRNGRALRVTLCTRERGRLQQSRRVLLLWNTVFSLYLQLPVSRARVCIYISISGVKNGRYVKLSR